MGRCLHFTNSLLENLWTLKQERIKEGKMIYPDTLLILALMGNFGPFKGLFEKLPSPVPSMPA